MKTFYKKQQTKIMSVIDMDLIYKLCQISEHQYWKLEFNGTIS